MEASETVNQRGPLVHLTPGQTLSLAALSLHLVDVASPLGSAPALPTLAPSALFRVPPGATLTLEDVTIVLSVEDLSSALQSMCSDIDNWPYSPSVVVDQGVVRLGHHVSTAKLADGGDGGGGVVMWRNVTITCPGYGLPPRPVNGDRMRRRYPCSARAVSNAQQLRSVADELLASTDGPVILSLTANMTPPPGVGMWEPIILRPGGLLVLLGSPSRPTVLDMAGTDEAVALDTGRSWPPSLSLEATERMREVSAPVTHFRDLIIVNLSPAFQPRFARGVPTAPDLALEPGRDTDPLSPPRLFLANVTLVIPEPEWRALAAAVRLRHDGPPQPEQTINRAAMHAFAKASRPLSYDPTSGVLVLTTARYHGWAGANVTLTYALPPDAARGTRFAKYEPHRLPQRGLAEVGTGAGAAGLGPPAAPSPPQLSALAPQLTPPPQNGANTSTNTDTGSPPPTGAKPPLSPPYSSRPPPLLPPPSSSPAKVVTSPPQSAPATTASTGGSRSAGLLPPYAIPIVATLSAVGGLLLLFAAGLLWVLGRLRQMRRGGSRGSPVGLATPLAATPHTLHALAALPAVTIVTDPIDAASDADAHHYFRSALAKAYRKMSCCLATRTSSSGHRGMLHMQPLQHRQRPTAGATSGRWGYSGGGGGRGAVLDETGAVLDEAAYAQVVGAYFEDMRIRMLHENGVANEGHPVHSPDGSRPLESCAASGVIPVPDGMQALKAELQGAELEVQALVGRGAYGVVYRGLWRGLPVAVKTLVVPDAAGGDENAARQRAVLEAAISMSMAHPNVVATYSYELKPMVQTLEPTEPQVMETARLHVEASSSSAGSTEEASAGGGGEADAGGPAECKLYVVQELCNGGSLRYALAHGMAGCVRAGGAFRLLALRLALDVALGMRHLHSCDAVHGDLKPENVLLVSVTPNDGDTEQRHSPSLPIASGTQAASEFIQLTAKVADFGLSGLISTSPSRRRTQTSQMFQGKPAYIAPEVASSGQLSPRGDVWSFGVMLIELFYGCTLEDIRQPQLIVLSESSQHGFSAVLQGMMASLQWSYVQLAAACLLVDPNARPEFAEIVSKLLSELGS